MKSSKQEGVITEMYGLWWMRNRETSVLIEIYYKIDSPLTLLNHLHAVYDIGIVKVTKAHPKILISQLSI